LPKAQKENQTFGPARRFLAHIKTYGSRHKKTYVANPSIAHGL